MGGYEPLKSHPFFETINWDDLHLQTPPKLTPYLPAMSEDDEDCYGNVNTHTYTYMHQNQSTIKLFVLINSYKCSYATLSFFLFQYDDLLSQFSNMQVAQPGPSPSLAESSKSSLPVCNPAPSVDQFIHVHEMDSNSMELDLQFSEEQKRLLLDKQSAANPWYTHTRVASMQRVIQCDMSAYTLQIFQRLCVCVICRHQFVENNLILKMGPVDKRKVSLRPALSDIKRSVQG